MANRHKYYAYTFEDGQTQIRLKNRRIIFKDTKDRNSVVIVFHNVLPSRDVAVGYAAKSGFVGNSRKLETGLKISKEAMDSLAYYYLKNRGMIAERNSTGGLYEFEEFINK